MDAMRDAKYTHLTEDQEKLLLFNLLEFTRVRLFFSRKISATEIQRIRSFSEEFSCQVMTPTSAYNNRRCAALQKKVYEEGRK